MSENILNREYAQHVLDIAVDAVDRLDTSDASDVLSRVEDLLADGAIVDTEVARIYRQALIYLRYLSALEDGLDVFLAAGKEIFIPLLIEGVNLLPGVKRVCAKIEYFDLQENFKKQILDILNQSSYRITLKQPFRDQENLLSFAGWFGWWSALVQDGDSLKLAEFFAQVGKIVEQDNEVLAINNYIKLCQFLVLPADSVLGLTRDVFAESDQYSYAVVDGRYTVTDKQAPEYITAMKSVEDLSRRVAMQSALALSPVEEKARLLSVQEEVVSLMDILKTPREKLQGPLDENLIPFLAFFYAMGRNDVRIEIKRRGYNLRDLFPGYYRNMLETDLGINSQASAALGAHILDMVNPEVLGIDQGSIPFFSLESRSFVWPN